MKQKQCIIFGKRLADLRASKGLTQKDLSSILNIQRVTIAKYEKGERSPMLDHIISFANYFGVTTDFLLGLSAKLSYEKIELNLSEYAKSIVIKSINHFSPEELGTLVYLCKKRKINEILDMIYKCAANIEEAKNIKSLVKTLQSELFINNTQNKETQRVVDPILIGLQGYYNSHDIRIDSAKYVASKEFSNLLDGITTNSFDILTECCCLIDNNPK